MTEQLKQKLNDSKVLRWSVLALVAFTMLCGYFLTDVMSPLKPMLEKELLWDSLDYGFFTSAYGWFNVFLLMLIFGGIILDKMGVRFTGMGACLLMVFGCGLKYYAVSTTFPEGALLYHPVQVLPGRGDDAHVKGGEAGSEDISGPVVLKNVNQESLNLRRQVLGAVNEQGSVVGLFEQS